ncbi:hypothetical protein BS50DRAFT_63720 [Corynespora cassiicola Philippines]|uniref:Uncharacterized protein n=1 Tax=Corynespora cassiicola Philippines TaxID=1448308 RepID=A0A2T2NJS3_CORCC|nr:hypothetical protein BS50DRAFT_63720 [Corynespora cassiicola Philippines]
MLPSTLLSPGTILWLPRAHDIPTYADSRCDIPPKCFGHPVLILNTDTSRKLTQLLIMTSFQNSTNIGARIINRKHTAKSYLSFFPADPLSQGAPSLVLCRGSLPEAPHSHTQPQRKTKTKKQRLKKKSWVYVQDIYTCPTAWLEETWDELWANPTLEGKRGIDGKSLEVLGLWGQGLGVALGVGDVLPPPVPRYSEARRDILHHNVLEDRAGAAGVGVRSMVRAQPVGQPRGYTSPHTRSHHIEDHRTQRSQFDRWDIILTPEAPIRPSELIGATPNSRAPLLTRTRLPDYGSRWTRTQPSAWSNRRTSSRDQHLRKKIVSALSVLFFLLVLVLIACGLLFLVAFLIHTVIIWAESLWNDTLLPDIRAVGKWFGNLWASFVNWITTLWGNVVDGVKDGLAHVS